MQEWRDTSGSRQKPSRQRSVSLRRGIGWVEVAIAGTVGYVNAEMYERRATLCPPQRRSISLALWSEAFGYTVVGVYVLQMVILR